MWRALREREGWSPSEAAEAIGVTPQFITGLERGGKTNTTAKILENASKVFRVSKEVLTWDGGKLPDALERFLVDAGLEGKIGPIRLAQLATFNRSLGRLPKPHEYGVFYDLLEKAP